MLASVAAGLAIGFPSRAALRADATDSATDADGDMLPDAVEWVVMTSAANADTDGDQTSDFVEVVQRGSPRRPGVSRAPDHEMRLVISGRRPDDPAGTTRMHLLFRFLGGTNLLSSFRVALRMPSIPGLEIPLDSLATGGIDLEQRLDPREGLLVHAVLPFASEAMLRHVMPCTITAEATIGGRPIRTAFGLFDADGEVATLMPFCGGFAVQTLAMPTSTGTGSNRVCMLELEQVGSGLAGAVFEVVDADCEDCNELECSPGCAQTLGWMFAFPNGLESITGG